MYDIVLWFSGVSALSVVIVGFLTIVCWIAGCNIYRLMFARPRVRVLRVWATNELNTRNLSNELATVTEWHQLGIILGIPPYELRKIEQQYASTDRRRTETLDLWLRQTLNASWSDVVIALRHVGENTLAERIHHKYIRGASPAAANPLQRDKPLDQTDCEPPTSTSPHETTLLLPQRLKLTISNCKLPSRIMAISKQAILHPDYEKLKDDEKLSLLMVVCNADSDTLEAVPFCVDLYETGMKEKNSTCYLSVNVSTNLLSTNSSQKHPTFHMQKISSLEPGQIALQFSFSQPDISYAITFSLHSIVDSEGIEVIGYSSESATLIIHTANCLPVYQDAAPVLGSGLPLRELSGPLKGSKYDQITKALKRMGLSGKLHAVHYLTNQLQKSPDTACDIKVLALIYAGSFIPLQKPSETLRSKKLFDKALKLSGHPDCQNSRLLEGMVLTYMAQRHRVDDHFEEAQSLLDRAKTAYFEFGAAPSGLTSSVYYQQAMIYAGQCEGAMAAVVKQKVEQQLTLMIDHGRRTKGYELQERTIYGLISMAMLHLDLFYPFHQHHQEQVSSTDLKPSVKELQLAKAYLDAVPDEFLRNESTSVHKALYYLTLSEHHRFSDNYVQALHDLKLAKKHAIAGNFKFLLKSIDVRLALLQSEDTFENIVLNFL